MTRKELIKKVLKAWHNELPLRDEQIRSAQLTAIAKECLSRCKSIDDCTEDMAMNLLVKSMLYCKMFLSIDTEERRIACLTDVLNVTRRDLELVIDLPAALTCVIRCAWNQPPMMCNYPLLNYACIAVNRIIQFDEDETR